MHQVAATIWNQIAEQQPLATGWAQQMFPLPEDDLDRALEREEARLGGGAVAAAYLRLMPLLWERTAILNFLSENPSLLAALPTPESPAEALQMARADFSLTPNEQKLLLEMLKKRPA